MSNRIPLAQVDRVTNGYVIRFAEAVQQERPAPPAFPPGHLELQAEIMLAMAEARDDTSEVWSDGGWERGRAETRREQLQALVKEIQETFANRKITGWVLEMREAFTPTLEGVTIVLAHAAKAHEQVVALVNHGVPFLGPLQPAMLHAPG